MRQAWGFGSLSGFKFVRVKTDVLWFFFKNRRKHCFRFESQVKGFKLQRYYESRLCGQVGSKWKVLVRVNVKFRSETFHSNLSPTCFLGSLLHVVEPRSQLTILR